MVVFLTVSPYPFSAEYSLWSCDFSRDWLAAQTCCAVSPEKARILFLFFFGGFLFWNPRREKKGSMGEGGSVVHQRRTHFFLACDSMIFLSGDKVSRKVER